MRGPQTSRIPLTGHIHQLAARKNDLDACSDGLGRCVVYHLAVAHPVVPLGMHVTKNLRTTVQPTLLSALSCGPLNPLRGALRLCRIDACLNPRHHSPI